MRPVRFVALSADGQALILTDEVGRMLSLAIDEQVSAAVSREKTGTNGQLSMDVEATLTPRDIQSRIRSGESAEHVARLANVPMEKVLRFAGPVLQERAAMAQLARRTRLRGADSGQSLADVVDTRLRSHGVDVETVAWDSYRRDDGGWRTTATWPSGKATAHAVWDLDRARSMVTPVDDMARFLSAEQQDFLISPEDSSGSGQFPPRFAEEAEPREGPVVPALAMLRRRDDRRRTETAREVVPPEDRRFDDLRPAAGRSEPSTASTSRPPGDRIAGSAMPNPPEPAASPPLPSTPARPSRPNRPAMPGIPGITDVPQRPAAASPQPAAASHGPDTSTRDGGWRDPWSQPTRRDPARDPGRETARENRTQQPADPAPRATPPATPGPGRREGWRERLESTGVATPPAPERPASTAGHARGRKTELPSWDDILFGSRRS
jgi:hypothetical protein